MMTSTTQDTTAYGSVEAGATKWVCAVGSEPDLSVRLFHNRILGIAEKI